MCANFDTIGGCFCRAILVNMEIDKERKTQSRSSFRHNTSSLPCQEKKIKEREREGERENTHINASRKRNPTSVKPMISAGGGVAVVMVPGLLSVSGGSFVMLVLVVVVVVFGIPAPLFDSNDNNNPCCGFHCNWKRKKKEGR